MAQSDNRTEIKIRNNPAKWQSDELMGEG